jgi:NAD(P)-dependent dehydrogenase (short-subunit alcohol dehydrogenase family)
MTINDTLSFAGQVALVTGAAGGLGFAYSQLLAQRGAHVVMQDIGAGLDGTGSDPQRIDQAVACLRAAGLSVEASHQGIATRTGAATLVAELLQQHGRLDVILHNAGWVEYQQIEAVDEDRFDHMMAVAAKAPLWLAQAAWPAMQAQGHGRIVLTTSDRALYPQYVQHGLAAYAAAKSAAVGIVNVLAAEGAAHGIVVNAVSPVAKTRMWGVHGEPDELYPEAVAAGVVFLASRACTEGGWILRASNGQFHATRLTEAQGVRYPRDLQAVSAGSVEQVAAQWLQIAKAAIEPR